MTALRGDEVGLSRSSGVRGCVGRTAVGRLVQMQRVQADAYRGQDIPALNGPVTLPGQQG